MGEAAKPMNIIEFDPKRFDDRTGSDSRVENRDHSQRSGQVRQTMTFHDLSEAIDEAKKIAEAAN
jgi:hypothetical protein